MITIHLNYANGDSTSLSAAAGQSLMQAITNAGLSGLEADCGGMMSCGTCHVFIKAPHAGQLPVPGPEENSMLDFTAVARQAHSRLSCQVVLTEDMNGVTIDLPATQY